MIEIDSGYFRGPGTVCPKTPLHIREMTSKETIQQLKEDIAILQEKLKKLEELARVKTPAEEAFYRVYSRYSGELDGSSWDIFEKGYNEAHKDAIENNKNFEPTSQTPEQVEQGLRDAMKKAKEDGVFDEPKPPTLLDIVYEWCDDDNDLPCEELVNRIKKWLSDEIEYEYGDGDYDKGWNDALRTIKDKLK
jgi:hypothetical protein